MLRRKTICFITPAHIAHNPRLVKEAIAAEQSGYRVRIISCQFFDWAVQFDNEILKRHPSWEFIPYRWIQNTLSGDWYKFSSGVQQRLNRWMFQIGFKKGSVPERAFERTYQKLLGLALGHPSTDLFIGHSLVSLPIVANASRKLNRPFGFDLEDAYFLQSKEFPAIQSRLVDYLERKYLPSASYLTAASPGIARAYSRHYKMKEPASILNVFPWHDQEESELSKRFIDRKDPNKISIYWFSQVIGPERGLEQIVEAFDLLKNPGLELHLRGCCDEGFKKSLLRLASNQNVGEQIYFHPQVDGYDLVRRTAEHDIGLVVENPSLAFRNITVANKFFMYLLCGLAIFASETEGQKEIYQQLPDVGSLFRFGDVKTLARRLSGMISNPKKLAEFKKNSLAAAKSRFNWENESKKFLNLIAGVLNP